MEFTRVEFLQMIHTMQKNIIDSMRADPEDSLKKRDEKMDLLNNLDELWSRVSVDRDKIFIIGIKD